MQKKPGELEREPDSPIALPPPMTWGKLCKRLHDFRLHLSILKGVVLLIFLLLLFRDGVQIIAKNAKMLGFHMLIFDWPLPFLLIGLWGLVVLTLSALLVATVVDICRQLAYSWHHLAPAQRKAV